MKVALPNMTIDFVDVHTENEAIRHAEDIFLEDIYKLPRPYQLIREDRMTNTFFVKVY